MFYYNWSHGVLAKFLIFDLYGAWNSSESRLPNARIFKSHFKLGHKFIQKCPTWNCHVAFAISSSLFRSEILNKCQRCDICCMLHVIFLPFCPSVSRLVLCPSFLLPFSVHDNRWSPAANSQMQCGAILCSFPANAKVACSPPYFDIFPGAITEARKPS